MPDDVVKLADALRRAKRVFAFTGAGLSTGSGIPDFRGPKGVWKTREPVYFQDFLRSEEKRVEYWDQKIEAHEAFRTAQPNAAHRALVELEKAGRLTGLVTQNIDGLHQAAGSDPERVVELHGTNRFVECVECGKLSDPEPAVARFRGERVTPTCDCGGFLKFATISFGQALRPEVLSRAIRAAEGCDLVLALGSTLSVQPAAGVALVALQTGVPYAIVNQGPTEHDQLASLRIEGDVVEVVPPAVASALA
ncbi:MAG TPA: Sir2 family NAD-dependent protein deacetylase [Myxococcales bacterium]|nr:Sir2 family NAD-dependent protein deacetylase [Myxococcales bacterium]